MTTPLRLLCVFAHPDDETLGTGPTLARYAAENVETYLVTATRGEHGWFGIPEENPGPDALGKIREQELHEAARVLGIHEVSLLDYIDGFLDQAPPQEAISQIARHIRRIRPDVVITFDPYGGYGHPDHIAISQFTTTAVVSAADHNYPHADAAPHRVSKLYYMVHSPEEISIYEDAFGELSMAVDGIERGSISWPEWAITTRVDSVDYWQQVWDAVACHKTQMPGYETLRRLPLEKQTALWRTKSYYRALSMVNGGRQRETDLFEDLRQ